MPREVTCVLDVKLRMRNADPVARSVGYSRGLGVVAAVVKSVRIILLSSGLQMVAFSLSLSFLNPPYCIAPGGLWRVEVVVV